MKCPSTKLSTTLSLGWLFFVSPLVAASSAALLFPQAVAGGAYECVLMISYKSTNWRGLAWFVTDGFVQRSRLRVNGQPLNPNDGSFDVYASGAGTRKFIITAIGTGEISGTIQISSLVTDDVGDIAASLFYNVTVGGSMANCYF